MPREDAQGAGGGHVDHGYILLYQRVQPQGLGQPLARMSVERQQQQQPAAAAFAQ